MKLFLSLLFLFCFGGCALIENSHDLPISKIPDWVHRENIQWIDENYIYIRAYLAHPSRNYIRISGIDSVAKPLFAQEVFSRAVLDFQKATSSLQAEDKLLKQAPYFGELVVLKTTGRFFQYLTFWRTDFDPYAQSDLIPMYEIWVTYRLRLDRYNQVKAQSWEILVDSLQNVSAEEKQGYASLGELLQTKILD